MNNWCYFFENIKCFEKKSNLTKKKWPQKLIFLRLSNLIKFVVFFFKNSKNLLIFILLNEI